MASNITIVKPEPDAEASAAETKRSTLPDRIHSRDLVPYRKAREVTVPRWLMEERRLVGAAGRHELWDHFCVLRSHVVQAMDQYGWRTLGVTSARRGEGKTWTAVNLAISVSRLVGRTALLVDANLRRPAVQDYFDIGDMNGLAEHLCEGAPLEQLLVHPAVGNLSVLAAGSAMFDSSDFLASEHMHTSVREMKLRYSNRIVIFDLPAVSDGDGVLSMLPHVDALLLVVEEGTTRDALARAQETLESAAIIGSVLNKSKEHS